METRMQRADLTAPTTPEQYRAAIERQERVIHNLRQERDQLRSDIQEMVKKAADNQLNGYRELGSRAAQAENDRDELAARGERLGNKLQELLAHPENGQTRHEGHAVLAETPAASLAHVRADAIDEAVEAARAKMDQMAERLGPPSEEQSEGIKGAFLDLRMYASEIRQTGAKT